MTEKSSLSAAAPTAWRPFALAGITAMAWGMTGVFVRLLPPLHPAAITAARLLIALPAAGGLALLFRSPKGRFRDTAARPESYVLATLLAGYYLLATTAFQMAPVAEVALLLSTPPLFVIAIERVVIGPPSRAAVRGALLATGGIAVTLSPGISLAETATPQHLLGDVLALCAAVLTAIYAHSYQRLSRKGVSLDATVVTFLTFLLGGLGAGLIAATQPSVHPFDPAGSTIALFLALGVLSTAVPTLGFAVVSNRLAAIMTSTISLFIPLFSGVFAYIALDEGITPLFLLGSVLVLWGVAMIVFQDRAGR